MSDAALASARRSKGLALPAGPRFALSEAPPAARFILRGGEGARVACGIAFGAEPPVADSGRRAKAPGARLSGSARTNGS